MLKAKLQTSGFAFITSNKHLVLLLLIAALPACAEVYQWQDKAGSQHYSDRAHENSKKIDIKPGYSFVTVKYVFDGDTVALEDGRKIRLLGINAPEVRHKGQLTEAGGDSAKRWLQEKIKHKKVRLVQDVETTDKYQRVLAHLFTENKDHINLQLVEQGLATVNIYPPNLMFVDQLTAAEKTAEQAQKGIWGQAEYTPIPVAKLDDNEHSGWLRVTGKVATIRSSRKYMYLKFNNNFQARIEKKWLQLFPDINTYRGQSLELRGKISKNQDGWSMLIRHPSAIKVLAK